jgi:hypothetical protein
MIEQHEHIGQFVTKEQQAAKELAAAAETRLKNLRLQTLKDCKARCAVCLCNPALGLNFNLQDLEARMQELDRQGLEMEQARSLPSPPPPDCNDLSIIFPPAIPCARHDASAGANGSAA